MAIYTSAQAGLWNDPATWGGGGYPSAMGDLANIGHTVTYNVVSTVALGQITINSGGILTFSVAMSTKLTLGSVDIQINNGGELRVGADGAIIPKACIAELIWNTASDNFKGINVANGGKLVVYGDPDYYGFDFDSYLTTNASIPDDGNPVTITIKDDFTTKWQVGQQLLVHKGGAYVSAVNDFCLLTITELSVNGSDTDIECTVTHRPNSSLICLADSDVLNLSRNVLLNKYSYGQNIGQYNNNRPRLTNANDVFTTNISINDASWGAWFNPANGYGYFSNRCVYRNGYYGAYQVSAGSKLLDIIIFAYGANAIKSTCNSIVSGYIGSGFGYGMISVTRCDLGITGGSPLHMFGCPSAAMFSSFNNQLHAYIYANNAGIYCPADFYYYDGGLGYNARGVLSANLSGDICNLDPNYTDAILINTKTQNPPTITGRNQPNFAGSIYFENYQQIVGAHYICDAAGDVTKTPADGTGDNPSQRSGGNADIIEVIPQSNCSTLFYLEILRVRLWATAGVSKAYRFYIQTSFTSLAKATGLVLYGEYLDAVSGGHLGAITSGAGASGNFTPITPPSSNWSEYVEVTMNPSQDGYVNLYLRLMGYESDKKVWVDPKVAITGGNAVTVTPRWSYGNVQLDIDPVATGSGGGSPANLGLMPLGIKQVAI